MKTLKWSLLVVLVTGVGVVTIMLRTRTRPLRPLAKANERKQTTERDAVVAYQPLLPATVPVLERTLTTLPAPHKTDSLPADIASAPANIMRVRADRVLAKVNDQAILLKHLVPVHADEQEQAMSAEEYESRLNRAIEMELTFQAAAAIRVGLTSEQKKRVDGIAQRHETTFQDYEKQGITWSSVTPAQVEFEKQFTAALLLQQNLVATETGIAPSSDPGVQARYEQARSEVLSRLKAQGNISVSSAEL